ncbi:MAG: ceramidase domain-containing protein [Pseudomonadales bacterium]
MRDIPQQERSQRKKNGLRICALTAVLSIVAMLLSPVITQDPSYHNFADRRAMLGVDNALNVLSNLPFLLVALHGYYLLQRRALEVNVKSRSAYRIFYVSIGQVSFGSGYYHLAPTDQTLIWDRLPMTLAFMALVSIVIGEFIDKLIAQLLLIPLLILGLSSVVYWAYSGDLRFYALIQFYPMLAIVTLLITFGATRRTAHYWWLLSAYIAAKLFEHFDLEIEQLLGAISGHPLKHLAAAIGVYHFTKGKIKC